jgi:BspA type Leucine rich repeat region (6 copies)
MNRITINFTPCSPPPENGYRVFYREIGDVSFIEFPDEFTSSPIVFEVDGPTNQLYEGYIISDCGDIVSEQVPFETVLCSELGDGCCDPEVIDAEAETIIPDGSGSSSVGGPFLRLVYNVNMSGETVDDWNTFFGTGIFDSVVYSGAGTVVDLYTTGTMSIAGSLFAENTTLVRILDFANCVESIGGSAFRLCTALLEIDLPALTSFGGSGAFFQCSSVTDVNIPLLTDTNVQTFAGCTSLANLNAPLVTIVRVGAFTGCGIVSIDFPNCITIEDAGISGLPNLTSLNLPLVTSIGEDSMSFYDSLQVLNLPSCTTVGFRAFRFNNALTVLGLPLCTDLGGTAGDDLVFNFIAGCNIVFTLESTTAGDADVAYLQANNSVTLILV